MSKPSDVLRQKGLANHSKQIYTSDQSCCVLRFFMSFGLFWMAWSSGITWNCEKLHPSSESIAQFMLTAWCCYECNQTLFGTNHLDRLDGKTLGLCETGWHHYGSCSFGEMAVKKIQKGCSWEPMSVFDGIPCSVCEMATLLAVFTGCNRRQLFCIQATSTKQNHCPKQHPKSCRDQSFKHQGLSPCLTQFCSKCSCEDTLYPQGTFKIFKVVVNWLRLQHQLELHKDFELQQAHLAQFSSVVLLTERIVSFGSTGRPSNSSQTSQLQHLPWRWHKISPKIITKSKQKSQHRKSVLKSVENKTKKTTKLTSPCNFSETQSAKARTTLRLSSRTLGATKARRWETHTWTATIQATKLIYLQYFFFCFFWFVLCISVALLKSRSIFSRPIQLRNTSPGMPVPHKINQTMTCAKRHGVRIQVAEQFSIFLDKKKSTQALTSTNRLPRGNL